MKKARSVFTLVGSAASAARAIGDVRSARGKGDRLLLANAIATVLVVITGAAVAVRDLRGGSPGDRTGEGSRR